MGIVVAVLLSQVYDWFDDKISKSATFDLMSNNLFLLLVGGPYLKFIEK